MMASVLKYFLLFGWLGTMFAAPQMMIKQSDDGTPQYTMKVYLFNVTNADDVVLNGAKPNLEEKGPYVFAETRQYRYTVQPRATTFFSFKKTRSFVFQEEESSGSLNDLITIPNVPAIAIVSITERSSRAQQSQLPYAMKLHKTTLYRTQTAGELIFDGYHDPFVQLVQEQTSQEHYPKGMIGIFYGRNNTDDGEYVMNTEVGDPDKVWDVVSWQNMNDLPYWPPHSPCAMIQGGEGYKFQRFLTKESVLRIFTPEIYRSIYVVYEKETEYQGISVYRYTPAFALFADPSLAPENSCFCLSEQCLPSGLLNISTAMDGAPLVISMPHFYLGDPLLLQTVDGLKPDKDKHQTVIDVEPSTGHTLNSARKFQLNVNMKSFPYLRSKADTFAYMPTLVHPVAWVEEDFQKP